MSKAVDGGEKYGLLSKKPQRVRITIVMRVADRR